jgi:type III pantothenate kinase
MKLLAIDAGNTRVKWGLHDGQQWFLRGSFATSAAGSSVAFEHLPETLRVERVLISNVAGAQVGAALHDRLYDSAPGIEVIASVAEQCGVINRYTEPSTLGSDRWAALIAAHAAASAAPRAQLVIVAGTALTVDALTADGEFLGGVIVAGLDLMRQSLNRATAQLPDKQGEYHTFPRRTADAITTGAFEAACGAIQRMYTHFTAHNGDAPHCIGSGGAMLQLAHHLPFPVAVNDHLVLDGLLAIARAG